jgi:hypothetical protein
MKSPLLTIALLLGASLANAQTASQFEISNVSIENTESTSAERFEMSAKLTPVAASSTRWQITQTRLQPAQKTLLGGDAIFADGFETAVCTP